MPQPATKSKLDQLKTKAAWRYIIIRIQIRNAVNKWTR